MLSSSGPNCSSSDDSLQVLVEESGGKGKRKGIVPKCVCKTQSRLRLQFRKIEESKLNEDSKRCGPVLKMTTMHHPFATFDYTPQESNNKCQGNERVSLRGVALREVASVIIPKVHNNVERNAVRESSKKFGINAAPSLGNVPVGKEESAVDEERGKLLYPVALYGQPSGGETGAKKSKFKSPDSDTTNVIGSFQKCRVTKPRKKVNDKKPAYTDTEDDFSDMGKVWTNKLRKLSTVNPQMATIAEKLINDIFFEADMGTLTRSASISIPQEKEKTFVFGRNF